MSAEQPADSSGARKQYEKPKLSEVALRPEEAVLGNCKSMGMSGPASTDCGNLACSSLGS